MKYYSEKTKLMYDNEEELISAEKAYDSEFEQKEALKEQRSKRAKELELAYSEAAEAYKKAENLKNQFIQDYGSFHVTLRSPSYSASILDDLFRAFGMLL